MNAASSCNRVISVVADAGCSDLCTVMLLAVWALPGDFSVAFWWVSGTNTQYLIGGLFWDDYWWDCWKVMTFPLAPLFHQNFQMFSCHYITLLTLIGLVTFHSYQLIAASFMLRLQEIHWLKTAGVSLSAVCSFQLYSWTNCFRTHRHWSLSCDFHQ